MQPKPDKISEITLLRHSTLGNGVKWALLDRKQMRWTLWLLQYSALIKFPSYSVARRGTQEEPDRSSELKRQSWESGKTKAVGGHRTQCQREEWCTGRIAEVCRGFLWNIQQSTDNVCWGHYLRQEGGKKHQKGLVNSAWCLHSEKLKTFMSCFIYEQLYPYTDINGGRGK